MIYLDYGATTPPRAEVIEEMTRVQSACWGNPSAAHQGAVSPRRCCNEARKTIARALSPDAVREVSDTEIFFTSGGSEGNNWCIKMAGFGGDYHPAGKHFVTTAMEHPSVLQSFHFLEQCGATVTYLKPDREGFITARQVEKALLPNTVLVSVMAANHEVGTIQPVEEIGGMLYNRPLNAYGRKCLFHVDGVQAVGHISVDVKKSHIDMLTASAHKFYGPKGAGFVYIREGIALPSLISGGGQELGHRAGTENVPGIAGMACAAHLAVQDIKMGQYIREKNLRDMLLAIIRKSVPGMMVNGSMENRLPGNLNISFPGIDGTAILAQLDMKGICISTGAACSQGSGKRSHVLTAMGLSENELRGSIRIGIGKDTTEEEILLAGKVLIETVEKLSHF